MLIFQNIILCRMILHTVLLILSQQKQYMPTLRVLQVTWPLDLWCMSLIWVIKWKNLCFDWLVRIFIFIQDYIHNIFCSFFLYFFLVFFVYWLSNPAQTVDFYVLFVQLCNICRIQISVAKVVCNNVMRVASIRGIIMIHGFYRLFCNVTLFHPLYQTVSITSKTKMHLLITLLKIKGLQMFF